MTEDSRAFMDLVQKALQVATAGVLSLGIYIASQALNRIERMEERQMLNEREDAVRELRLLHLEQDRLVK